MQLGPHSGRQSTTGNRGFLLASVLQAASSSLEGLDASEISYASLSEADDDVDPAIIDAIAGNPIPALRPMKKPGGGSLV